MAADLRLAVMEFDSLDVLGHPFQGSALPDVEMNPSGPACGLRTMTDWEQRAQITKVRVVGDDDKCFPLCEKGDQLIG